MLNSEDELKLEKNIVWLFSYPRSGSQWLGTQLLSFKTITNKGPSVGLQLGSIFIHRIEGCYSNVIGLPIAKLERMLKKVGISIL